MDRLPLFYNPGPKLAVEEQLMPFRRRFRVSPYIPSKPAKYRIKIWAACDAASSYAWNFHVYMGKPEERAPKNNPGMWVVLDVTQGLHNIT